MQNPIIETYKVIMVIGLPGSGKTELCKREYPEYVLHDDFVTSFFNGKVCKDIRAGTPVILNDPRLCNMDTFYRFTASITDAIEGKGGNGKGGKGGNGKEGKGTSGATGTTKTLKDLILLILFENNADMCLRNAMARTNKPVSGFIEFYKNIYKPKNYHDSGVSWVSRSVYNQ